MEPAVPSPPTGARLRSAVYWITAHTEVQMKLAARSQQPTTGGGATTARRHRQISITVLLRGRGWCCQAARVAVIPYRSAGVPDNRQPHL